MKSLNYIRDISLKTFVVMSLLLIDTACDNTKTIDTKMIAENQNEVQLETNYGENDAQFLVNAVENDLKGILLGQLAQERGSNSNVKAFGKMMVQAHEEDLKKLTALAGKMSVSIPNSVSDQGQQAYKDLNTKINKDFDNTFCDIMVNVHRDAITRCDKASTDSRDEGIRQLASAKLPALRNHLDQALTCQTECRRMN